MIPKNKKQSDILKELNKIAEGFIETIDYSDDPEGIDYQDLPDFLDDPAHDHD